ncbi:dihydroorotate oxidase, electron transfer subunit [Lactobacillus selangorensis]|uniref:Dihydroorotate dehydrogenase B (NAD(+)), electron transfer subunit n=1 Tax=Lactobacillus selangorensis TaxID=81857 RepID=A0A0R2G863_9LACO|nr:dihydroorotate dehydrogenase electron transfer subunit [Lactobacillus selangorensis]KRN28777.1 dihydroorotate oxidase, electron transfer subunit [Lactobacillus selangorensis]KRN32813.1 dihydroorotate oxidase, electron transfer subunit [Lactobacillus selangorensis]
MIQEKLTLVAQEQLTDNVFEMVLKGQMAHEPVTPGQFVDVKVPDESLLLRRPFGIASVDPNRDEIRLVYRTVGKGTHLLSELPVGIQLDTLGPLGHGFPTAFLKPGQHALIIGGGTGIPPLYELSRQLNQMGVVVTHAIGFGRRDQIFYADEFRALGEVAYATDDGSYGFHGHIGMLLDAQFNDRQFDAVYACGPRGLLMAVDNRYRDHPHAYISMESRMACGMGECAACVVAAKRKEQLLKVCSDGPVFATGKVEI